MFESGQTHAQTDGRRFDGYTTSSPCEPSADDHGLIFAYFTTRSNLVVYAFEWGETVTPSFNGNNLQMIKLTYLC